MISETTPSKQRNSIPRKSSIKQAIKQNPQFNLLPFLKSKSQSEKSKESLFFKKKQSLRPQDSFISIYTQNNALGRKESLKKLDNIQIELSRLKSQSVPILPVLDRYRQNLLQQKKDDDLGLLAFLNQSLESIQSVENENSDDDEKSVVWNDDEMKIRGIEIEKKEAKPLDQFAEIFKYRYETYPQRRFSYGLSLYSQDLKQEINAS